MQTKLLRKLAEIIREENDFILLTHLNPDPDGLGCVLTFGLYLKSLGKRVFPVVENLPKKIEYLHGRELLISVENFNFKSFESSVIILFDALSLDRIHEKVKTKLPQEFRLIVFDHHQPESKVDYPSGLYFVDSSSPSTSLIVLEVFKKLKVKITSEMASNLLAGLYFDTGCFRYENTGQRAFKAAQELSALGANPSLIARALYEEFSIEEINLLKKILERLEISKNDLTFAISYLTLEDLKDVGSEDVDSLANILRGIRGVNVSALVKEIEKNYVAVSLRSKAPVEVLELARMFGGGGHRYASGFKLKVENISKFLEEFKHLLRGFYGKRIPS